MKKLLQLALGIIAAIGGYLDIGDLVFTTGAGATYGYKLLWAVPVGVLGIAVYAEMCGRVAAVTKRPVMDIVRQRLGFGMGLATLCASQAVNLMTLAAEVGGLALVLQLLFDFSYTALVLAGILALIVIAYMSQVHTSPDLAVELFVLEPGAEAAVGEHEFDANEAAG